MNAQLCHDASIENSWIGGRVAAASTEAARAALATFQSVWREQSKATERVRSFEMMVDVSDRVLKDIGAPEWLVARAAERRNSHALHLLELFRS
jgi:hypothetical protein